mmetsp:Transcript_48850/g.121210  ORF Transcript_48850/g.121210 Transcript_48850/m.121210 type:complete len:98 (-) Transcript_48850:195-488(-)
MGSACPLDELANHLAPASQTSTHPHATPQSLFSGIIGFARIADLLRRTSALLSYLAELCLEINMMDIFGIHDKYAHTWTWGIGLCIILPVKSCRLTA